MDMNIYDKSMLTVVGVVLFCLFVISVGLGIGWPLSGDILMELQHLDSGARIGAVVVGLLLAFLSANMFRMVLHRPPSIKAVISETNLGKVRIAVDAIRDLIIKAVRQIEGIRSADVEISVSDDNLSLNLTLCILPDIDIPAICEIVQATLQEYVHATVGISIDRIDVLVRNVTAEKKSRVE
jgi:uncharacterized alkaline shock family protein YloU